MALYLDASLRRTALPDVAAPRTYIRSREFDSTLLLAPIFAGSAAALAVTADPRLYPFLLVADLWLLGYHHVVATYTRLAFDTQSLRRNRVLAVDLLVGVTLVTLGVAMTAGAWVIASAFLYLQWFHYMRQGYGIARMYYRATPEGQIPGSRDVVADLAIYLVPIYGIAAAHVHDGRQVPRLAGQGRSCCQTRSWGCSASWRPRPWSRGSSRRILAAANETMDPQYTGFIASHIAIFLVAYVFVDDVNAGWLAINVWHNFQYVLVVWMSNAKRYAAGIDPTARFLSRLSQPGRVTMYFACCLAITTIVYAVLDRFTVLVLGGGMAVTHRHLHGHQLPPLHRRCPDLETPQGPSTASGRSCRRHLGVNARGRRRALGRPRWSACPRDSSRPGQAQPAAVHLRRCVSAGR